MRRTLRSVHFTAYHRAALVPALALSIATAVAPPATKIDLDWDAPRECPDLAAVRAEIEQLALGERRPVSAIGVVTRREGGHWHLDLEIETATGRQHFAWEAMACESLARGAALAIVAAGDATALAVPVPPSVEAPATPVAPPTEAMPPAAAPPDRDPTAATAAASREPSPVRASTAFGWLRLHAAAGVAQLPGFDGRLGLGGGVGWKWLRAEAIAAVTLPREERSLALAVGARMVALDVAARIGASTTGRFAVGGMLGTELGTVRASGFGVVSPQTAGDLWIAATIGPVLAIAVARRLGFFAGIDGVVALRRPRFAIRERADATEGEIVFRPRAGGVRVWLGFGVRFADSPH